VLEDFFECPFDPLIAGMYIVPYSHPPWGGFPVVEVRKEENRKGKGKKGRKKKKIKEKRKKKGYKGEKGKKKK